MEERKKKIVGFLLERANPSIVLRVRREVLGGLSVSEEEALTEAVLRDRNIAATLASQRPDGWIGAAFHGSSLRCAHRFDNMEVGLRFLAEKGLLPGHPAVAAAVRALADTPISDPAYGARRPLERPEDDYAVTGAGIYLPRSSIAIRAGYEDLLPASDQMDLKRDIAFSLRSFLAVRGVGGPEEILETRRGKLCFRQGVLWPCVYHLRMLAFSRSWRSEKTLGELSESVAALAEFPYAGFVYTYAQGQLKGPCMPFVHSGPLNETLADGAVGGMYFDRLELFARCGVLTRVVAFGREFDRLMDRLDGDGLFRGEVKSKDALGWSPYFGFALEEDWRSKQRRQCDLLFRILMVMEHRDRCR